uniref:Retrotransposon gag domain-containing protein n=1 Tax=Anopheles stephensi TaxID=30069 RepID=A0A182YR41_ANOST
MTDYFDKLEWALQLSNIPKEKYADYARVHGSEFNNAFKFLFTPESPEKISYAEPRQILQQHFDQAKNKFVESIKFRSIRQQKGERIAQFVLRLKQGAAFCVYGTFLDRMFIEQMLHGFDERAICDAIIAKNPMTFKEAFDTAATMEAMHNTAREVGTVSPVPEATHRLGFEKPRTKKQQQRTTFRLIVHRIVHTSVPHNRRISAMAVENDIYEANATTLISDIDVVQSLHNIHNILSATKTMIDVHINGYPLKMELNTGALCGIMSKVTLRIVLPNSSLKSSDRHFSSYTGHRINFIGRLVVQVYVGDTTKNLFSGKFHSLFGREWIANFVEQINFHEMFSIATTVNTLSSIESSPEQAAQLSQLLKNFDSIFSDVLGMLTGPSAMVHLKPDVTLVFARARDVPLALRERYAAEIDRKLAFGFYEKVDFSEWASSTHIVIKKNEGIRITGNYKPTVNPKMVIDEHPIRSKKYSTRLRELRCFVIYT